MITEEQIDLLVERLVRRTEKANIYFLEKIGEAIKELRDLRPTEAHKLKQILLYGGNYEDIIAEISRLTDLSARDIEDIFYNYAKKDYSFYKDFYKYKSIPFVDFTQNKSLLNQTKALVKATQNEFLKFTRPRVLGYSIKDATGKLQFTGLKETYERVIDEAILNVGQGKETYNQAMQRIIQDIGGSGLKTVDFESGRSIRLDSMVRQHIKGSLAKLHNENQEIIGEEIDFDGWEITTHSNPAPDHQEAQGRRFNLKEFENLQKYGVAKDITGKEIDMHYTLKSGEEAEYFRPISEHNCYHRVFSVVLNATEPEHTEEELQEIIDRNNKGFDYEGKHYSMYEGTQLQRRIETEIRKHKDLQILATKSGDLDLARNYDQQISVLLKKYKEVSDISGLPTKLERLKVVNYRRTKKI